MNSLQKLFSISVIRKFAMALTGLFLCLFLVEHLIGNLLLYKGDNGETFEAYSKFMAGNMIIRALEIVLFAAILFHIIDAIVLTMQNKKARPVEYKVNKPSKNSSWFSRNMGLSGSVIFIFLILHLRTFFVEHRILEPQETMYMSVVNAFQQWWYSAIYLIAMVLLAAHLNHGFQSAFQSLGLNNKKYAPILKNVSTWFAILISLGFASFPIVFYFNILGVK